MGRQPCCVGVGLKKGPWSIEEDHRLVNFILNNGIHCWRNVPKLAGLLRCGKSCRLRWINYLRPDLKRGALSEAEEEQIIQLHARLGNRWSKIASYFPGRTDNEIKNIWNTKIKKRLKLVGLDLITHKPIEEEKKEKEIEEEGGKIENKLTEKNSGGTLETERELNNDMSITVEDNKNNSIPREVIEITEFLEDYDQMLLMNDEIKNSPPSIGESSSSSSSKEDSVQLQQWVESVDSILSWDYFDKLEDEFFFFG